MQVFKFILIVAVFLSVGCAKNKNAQVSNADSKPTQKQTEQSEAFNPKAILLNISTSPCFGSCPVYEFKVYESGGVVFNGKRFTHLEGEHFAQLSADELNGLKAMIEDADLASANAVYDNPQITDLPSTTILVQTNGGLKSIKARYGTPDHIREFIDAIYQLTKNIKWDQNQVESTE